MNFSFKKIVIYLFGLALLGLCVTLMQRSNLGMSTWDAFFRNLYEGIPLDYKYLNPIVAMILLPIAYAIQKKKITLWILFPLLISFYVGLIVDLLLPIIPSVVEGSILANVAYLSGSIVVCAIGLNMITYVKFPLPALDELCYAIGVLLHTTYGKGKLIGEGLALSLAILAGLVFHHQAQWFYIGIATVVFGVVIGPLIDLFKKPVHRVLEAIQ